MQMVVLHEDARIFMYPNFLSEGQPAVPSNALSAQGQCFTNSRHLQQQPA
jgi:hypothetical protein